MTVVGTCNKDPQDIIIRALDWSLLLAGIGGGVTISTSTWKTSRDLVLANLSFSGAIASVKISGGVSNNDYTITNHVVLSNGEEYDRSLTIKVVEL